MNVSHSTISRRVRLPSKHHGMEHRRVRELPLPIAIEHFDELHFEILMQAQRELVVAERIGEEGECELRGARAAASPLESCRRMVDEIEPRIERTAVAIYLLDGDDSIAVRVTLASVSPHCILRARPRRASRVPRSPSLRGACPARPC